MDIALNTDFMGGIGSPQDKLKLISEAGFTHLHWCHQWCTDFFYNTWEIAEYKKWLKQYQLKLLDIHGSAGREKSWYATEEYRRKSGVLLVLNRIIFLRELDGTGCVMMHAPNYKSRGQTPEERALIPAQVEALKKSLDELLPYLEKYDTKIAIENLRNDNFEILGELLSQYPAKYVGITLDTGHANIEDAQGLMYMEKYKDRLLALHLNDNDTTGDLHQPPFYGNLDWEKVAGLLAGSSYADTDSPLSFELSIRQTPFLVPEVELADQPEEKVREFLAESLLRCQKVTDMYEFAKENR